ncbi:MAG: hypothetical protein ACRCVT_04100 [Leadbetterella sp.]
MRFTHLILIFLGSLQLALSQTNPELSTKGRFMFVNNKPFFAIGLYDFPSKRTDDAIWKEAAEAGINFMMSSSESKYGIKVSRPIPKIKGRSLMEVHQGKDVQQQLTAFLNKYENDTSTICWHAPDEPSWFGPTPQVLINGYDFVKKNSKKPVWLNVGPSFTSSVEHYGRPEEYLESCDIISEDIYPFPDSTTKNGQGYNHRAFLVGEHTERLVNMSKVNYVQQKPVWMVLQGFGWASLNGTFKNPESYVPPTRNEMRYMVYDAIIHGATGVVFWGLSFENTDKPSGLAIWNTVKNVSSELKNRQAILTSLTSINPTYLTVKTNKTENPIKYALKLVDKEIYIIAVNTRAQAVSNAQFSVADVYKGNVSKVLNVDTNKTLEVSENKSWNDTIEGYGVRIYKTDMNFAFMKK